MFKKVKMDKDGVLLNNYIIFCMKRKTSSVNAKCEVIFEQALSV